MISSAVFLFTAKVSITDLPPYMMLDKMTLGSLNVRGINCTSKRQSVFHHLRRKNFDVCLLQETHMENKDLSLWKQQWSGRIYASCGDSKSKGVAILINPKLGNTVEQLYQDVDGRIIIISINICDKNFLIVNVYGPNTDQPEFIQEVIQAIENVPDYDYLIMGGDFNFVMNPSIDRKDSVINHHNSCEILQEYMNKTNI